MYVKSKKCGKRMSDIIFSFLYFKEKKSILKIKKKYIIRKIVEVDIYYIAKMFPF